VLQVIGHTKGVAVWAIGSVAHPISSLSDEWNQADNISLKSHGTAAAYAGGQRLIDLA
jgi:hypothetical protein